MKESLYILFKCDIIQVYYIFIYSLGLELLMSCFGLLCLHK